MSETRKPRVPSWLVASIAGTALVGGGAGAGAYALADGGSGQASAPVVITAAPAALKTAASTITDIYKRVAPGVVEIEVSGSSGQSSGRGFNPYFGGPEQTQGQGSGFVLDANGDIVTNQHVVDGASSITVKFQNGKTAKATLVGTDPSSDVAVIKVDVPAAQLTLLELGSSASLQPGEGVVALGSPFGLQNTITAGIVSAVGRVIRAPNGYSISGAIQTDAAINPGNSGGPLLDSNGRVVGVNAQIDSQSGTNDGVGFALPIDSVKDVVSQLISGGKIQHAFLGVRIGNAAQSAGAVVGTVQSGTPAASAGVQRGDVITAVDRKTISSADDLTATIAAHKPGDKITLTVTRADATKQIDVTLGARST